MRSSAVGPDRAVDRSSAPPQKLPTSMLATKSWRRDRLWHKADIDRVPSGCPLSGAKQTSCAGLTDFRF